MDKNTKIMIKEINDGKNLEDRIPQYINALTENYYYVSLLNLAMNYYTLYEQVLENTRMNEEAKASIEVINHCLEVLFSGSIGTDAFQEAERQLFDKRNEIMEKMQVLTAHADRIQIYEYILNRMELNYSQAGELPDEREFVKRLVGYIFSQKDNVVVNERIKEAIGQLPVRMARSRYFELVKNSLSIYLGSDRSSLDTYEYMIRTSAMLYTPKGEKKYFTQYLGMASRFQEADYANLSKEDYDQLVKELTESAEGIVELSDLYVRLQELTNQLYACIMAAPYCREAFETNTSQICARILLGIKDRILKGQGDSRDELVSLFQEIEGRQEVFYQEKDQLESMLFQVKSVPAATSRLDSDKRLKNLTTMSKLLANSYFIELDDETEEIVTEEYLNEITGKLLGDLEESFRKWSRPVIRAVIAGTINKMPVFFKSAEEVAAYIESTLAQCRDAGEKQVSMEIIRDIMDEAELG